MKIPSVTVLLGLVGCHAASVTAPPEAPPTLPPIASSSPAQPTTPDSAEDGELVADEATLGVRVERGGAQIVSEHRVAYRDSQDRLRVREIAPHDARGDERSAARLALGDRVSFGAWDVRWIGIRDGLVRLQGRFRTSPVGEWSTAADDRVAPHELRSQDQLFAFEVRVTAIEGRPDRADGRVELRARAIELAAPAKFGDTLSPGVFVFPDGLRLHVEQLDGCDFDVSAPCPFGGTYRADAALGEQAARVALGAKLTKILGHTLDLGRGTFVVRK